MAPAETNLRPTTACAIVKGLANQLSEIDSERKLVCGYNRAAVSA